jgi:hypothetical protein
VHEVDERIVDARAVRKEETTARGVIVEEKQFLILADLAVVVSRCLCKKRLVRAELSFVRK